ncbi:MAG: 2-aminoethylphosphonate--pyruvate transaminase [Deltaproteobacteria bacterium]|nr:2-aminoethylphosphonate--pyruvate transaminase [Deltaproteobacteria bacterium]
MILMNPGPANTTATVKQALVCEDICPREKPFGELIERVRNRLTEVVHRGGDFTAVLLSGSGTAAVEAAIASAIPARGRLLVIDNGAYGARMAEIASAYRISHDVLSFGVGEWPEPDRVRRRLSEERYSHVAVVHHETTTGMLNPVENIARLAHETGALAIVDAMSSFAGVPIDIEALGADFLVSSSNKCIQGMAGISFVIARRSTLDDLRSISGRSYYLDLGAQHRFFEDTHQMRFTPPVQILYALDRAIEEFFEEGQEGRWQRYQACFEVLDAGVRRIGFERLLPDRMLSKILTAYLEPDHPRYSYDALHDTLLAAGYTIYPGKGAKRATFRLANMGAISPRDMTGFVEALELSVRARGLLPLYSSRESR